MDFKRQIGESDEDLFIRICNNKDSIGSWNKVAEVLNNAFNKKFDESTYRKKFKALNNDAVCCDEDKATSSNWVPYSNRTPQIIDRNQELEAVRREKIKIQTLNIERNRYDRSVARQELFYENVASCIEKLPLPKFEPIHYNNEDLYTEYVLCLSDMHYGSCFSDGINTYTPKNCKIFLEELADYVKSFMAKKEYQNLKVVNLGDTIQGMIHLSDIKLNDSSVVESIVQISRLIAMFLNDISTVCHVDYIHVPTANHTQLRSFGTKANELPDEDFEYVIVNYISDLCANNDRISVQKACKGYKDYISTNIAGYNVALCHGHLVKNLEGALKSIGVAQDEAYDYLIMGHQHGAKSLVIEASRNELGFKFDREVIVCPSFIGTDPYSTKIMKSSSPSVVILGFSPDGGHVETNKFVF